MSMIWQFCTCLPPPKGESCLTLDCDTCLDLLAKTNLGGKITLTDCILQDTIRTMIEIRQTDIYKKWFASLKDRNARARIDVRIRRISLGNFGDVKPVGEGVFEIRIDYGPGYRIYYVRDGNTIIILLCGGDKSTQPRDIQKAHEIAMSLREEE